MSNQKITLHSRTTLSGTVLTYARVTQAEGQRLLVDVVPLYRLTALQRDTAKFVKPRQEGSRSLFARHPK